ncbi:MAG TPA: sigma 54-interacting transcriptional regulator, partial [Polyangia bacterium]|nr:sigma 54-interacting transcriptional regulator [Polyangia bacterium]
LAARALHSRSGRRGRFVAVNCGALPPDLVESELFGHERGAFTGADAARAGAFELADGGTVFLDEIGELPLALQPLLLRALVNDKRFRADLYYRLHVLRVEVPPLRERAGDVELLAAHKFRSDLYYRLAVVEVKLPPLRERLPDLPMLVEHIVRNLGTIDDQTLAVVRSEEFLSALAHHNWPGNIRELRNYLERCVALRDFAAPKAVDAVSASPESAVNIGQPLREAREGWVSAFEKRYLEELLRVHENRVSAAARAAGVDRIYFYRLLWKHGLRTREPSMRDAEDAAP